MTILDRMMVALGFQVDDTGLEKFQARAMAVQESAISLSNVVGGILTGAFTKFFMSFVDTGAEFEKYATVLGVLYDSTEQGKQAAEWISNFAVKTPFQLAELTQAFIRLKAFGLDPTQGSLKAAGDAAAAFGRPLMDAVFAMDDAIEGINRPLRTFGISVKEQGNMVTYSYMKNGQMISKTANKLNKIMVAQTIQAIWNERYGGAMDKLSLTWIGTINNMKDQLTRFKQKVMESGPFQNMKAIMTGWLDRINKAVSDGTAERFARVFDIATSTIYRGFEELWKGIDVVVRKTVGWKVVIGALSLVMTGILASAIGNTISLVTKLIGTMLTFDLASTGILILAAALFLVIDDLWAYYHGQNSVIGLLMKKFPHAVAIAYAAIGVIIAGMVALKWASITSLVETIAIMGMYAAEWVVTAATALASVGEIIVAAATMAAGWIASFASMAVATIAATWPVLAIIAAVALVGVAVYELWKHWDTVTKAMHKAWSWLLGEIKSGVGWLSDHIAMLVQKVPILAKLLPNSHFIVSAGASPVGSTGAASFASNSVNSGGGVIGRAGSNINTTSSATHTSHTEIHAPITVVSPDPDAAGKSVQKVLDKKHRQIVRNGQSAVAY